jgi:hypothetical protein
VAARPWFRRVIVDAAEQPQNPVGRVVVRVLDGFFHLLNLRHKPVVGSQVSGWLQNSTHPGHRRPALSCEACHETRQHKRMIGTGS